MKPSSSPRAANTRAARSREQRENILDAARQSFAERGFHGASMALIAEKAGISVGLIYRYFAGKSELIQGIVEQQMAVLADDLRELEADNRAPVEKVMDIFRPDSEQRRCGRRHLEPALVLEITAEASRDAVIADALERFNQHIDTALGDWLASPVAEGGFGLAPASLPGGILVLRALVDGLKMRQTREGTAFDLKQLQQALAERLPKLMQA